MRIRKNFIFPHLVAPNSYQHIYNCQLNQYSPWDVVDTSNISPPPQVYGGSSFRGNGRFQDSFGALERAASLKIYVSDDEEVCGDMNKDEEEQNETIYCNKSNDKGELVCGREVKNGNVFCDFHLVHVGSSNSSGNGGGSMKNVKKKKKAKKPKFESNPHEIYYYTGFGPRWAKKRGGDDKLTEMKTMDTDVANVDVDLVAAKDEVDQKEPEPVDTTRNQDFKYVEDDVEDEDEDDDDDDDENVGGVSNGKKRGRKPIKARSLKSLM